MVTLLWPPAVPDGYSLIVDGTATGGTDDTGAVLAVTPTGGVLHRPNRAVTSGSSYEADCIQTVPFRAWRRPMTRPFVFLLVPRDRLGCVSWERSRWTSARKVRQ